MGDMIKERIANETAALQQFNATADAAANASGAEGGGEGVKEAAGDAQQGKAGQVLPEGHDAQVLLRTGPGIWSDAVHR